jgi:hypothetical protein
MAGDLSSTIVFAGPSTEAAIVWSFLESKGIAAHVVEEHIGTTAPHRLPPAARAPLRSSSRLAMPCGQRNSWPSTVGRLDLRLQRTRLRRAAELKRYAAR